MRTLQLLPGLEIQFAEDGTWLHFDGGGNKSTLRLESIGSGIIHQGIADWCERIRESAVAK